MFDDAAGMGFKMELLDIGGGFTGHFDECGNVMFGEIANTINAALATYFPPGAWPLVRACGAVGSVLACTMVPSDWCWAGVV